MIRSAVLVPLLLALAWLRAGPTMAAGPPFPDPIDGQAVYDAADVLDADAEAHAEEVIDRIEARSGAELVVYTQLDPGISEDENLANARALIDQWGVGRSGFDDGLVLMIGLEGNRINGRVSLYGGSGFLRAYAGEEELKRVIEERFVPAARSGDMNGAVLAALDELDSRITDEARQRLEVLRIANAALGLVTAPLALLVILGLAWRRWKRDGDDPRLTDSPSILMAGPPAGMTPALATVVRRGTADQRSISTLLVTLASFGRLRFRNLDGVREARSDSDPDPATDPAIDLADAGDGREVLAGTAEARAWDVLRRLGGSSRTLSREPLWKLNSELDDVKGLLEAEAVRLGWLSRLPGPHIGAMTGVGLGIVVMGALVAWAGLSIPMSGALLLGGALVAGGIGTVAFGRAMSQRTAAGAYVDAMLTAYRRTLARTMEQARSMGQVLEQPDVRRLADTPDKVFVWGMALGLHDELAALMGRELEERRRQTGSPAGGYYPTWLGSTPESAWQAGSGEAGGVSRGSGSIFSGSAVPDIGGMFDALGSIGSSPSSSSGSGGGFSGGGSSGGGGASGSF